MNFNLPMSAQKFKKIPKNKLIPKTKQGIDGNKIFYDISTIAITYWLSETTINTSTTEKVKEIIILEVVLKTKEIPKEAIKIIQSSFSMSSPILFVFKHQDNFCYGISLLDEKKYYFSKWNEEKQFNFNDTNLEKVYQNIFKLFLTNVDKETSKHTDFKQSIEIDNKITNLNKQIDTLKGKISREKQFNKKTELNKELKKLKNELQILQG